MDNRPNTVDLVAALKSTWGVPKKAYVKNAAYSYLWMANNGMVRPMVFNRKGENEGGRKKKALEVLAYGQCCGRT